MMPKYCTQPQNSDSWQKKSREIIFPLREVKHDSLVAFKLIS